MCLGSGTSIYLSLIWGAYIMAKIKVVNREEREFIRMYLLEFPGGAQIFKSKGQALRMKEYFGFKGSVVRLF